MMSNYIYKTIHLFKQSKDLIVTSLHPNFYVKKYWRERVLVLEIQNQMLWPKFQVFLLLEFDNSDYLGK